MDADQPLADPMRRLIAAMDQVRERGIRIGMFGPDERGERLRIEVTRTSVDAREVLQDLLPGVPLTVVVRPLPENPAVPTCDEHYPLTYLTASARHCPQCNATTNGAFLLCPACAREQRTCVICGANALFGL